MKQPTYKELLMRRDAFHELQNKIRRGLSAFPQTSGGEILSIDLDLDTNDLIVTAMYEGEGAGAPIQRTHQIIIKDVT